MKNVCKKIFMFVCFFSLSRNVYAICSNEDLVKYKNEAASLKVNYEIIKEEYSEDDDEPTDLGVTYKSYRDNFKVSATNLSDNLYVVLKNDKNKDTVTFSNAGKLLSTSFYDHTSVINLTYEVYTNSNTLCPNEKLLTNYLSLPMFNSYASSQVCFNAKEADVCAEYVSKEVTQDEFDNYFKKKREQYDKDKKEEDALKNKKSNNKIYFIIGGSVLGLVVIITTAIIINKRRGRLI